MIYQKDIEKEIDTLLKQGKSDMEVIHSLSSKYKIRRCDVSTIMLCSEVGRRSTDGIEGWLKRGRYGYFERTSYKV